MKPSLYNFFKGIFKSALHTLGFDVVRYNLHHSGDVLLQTIYRQFGIRTVIDVGANEGQYIAKIIQQGFGGKVYSFEPIPSVFEKLKKNSASYPNWTAINLGIGSKEEELLINVSENFESSSILNVGENSVHANPATKTTHQEKIKVITLDSFLAGGVVPDKPMLLKLDVQGFEMEALQGALGSLQDFSVLQVELSFIPVYQGAPSYHDVTTFLEGRGFEIFTLLPAFIDDKTGRMLQADGVFVRKSKG